MSCALVFVKLALFAVVSGSYNILKTIPSGSSERLEHTDIITESQEYNLETDYGIKELNENFDYKIDKRIQDSSAERVDLKTVKSNAAKMASPAFSSYNRKKDEELSAKCTASQGRQGYGPRKPRYKFNRLSRHCWTIRGIIKQNLFESKAECERICKHHECHFPRNKGIGPYKSRYIFNNKTKTCDKIIGLTKDYLFETKAECHKTCAKLMKRPKIIRPIIKDEQDNKYVRIKCGSKYLDIDLDSTGSDGKVVLKTYQQDLKQLWFINKVDGNHFIIRSAFLKNKVLNVQYARFRAGDKLILWDDVNSLNEKFYFENRYIKSAGSNKFVLTVNHGTSAAKLKNEIILWIKKRSIFTENQFWTLVPAEEEYSMITNPKYARIKCASSYLDIWLDMVLLYGYYQPNSSQVWYLDKVNQENFIIRSTFLKNKVLNVQYGQFNRGDKLILWDDVRTLNEQFVFQNGYFKSAGNQNLVLTVNHDNINKTTELDPTKHKQEIILWDQKWSDPGSVQIWSLVPVPEKYLTIREFHAHVMCNVSVWNEAPKYVYKIFYNHAVFECGAAYHELKFLYCWFNGKKVTLTKQHAEKGIFTCSDLADQYINTLPESRVFEQNEQHFCLCKTVLCRRWRSSRHYMGYDEKSKRLMVCENGKFKLKGCLYEDTFVALETAQLTIGNKVSARSNSFCTSFKERL